MSNKTIEKLHNLRLAGNAVVHPYASRRLKKKTEEIEERIQDLYDIIKELYSKR